MRPLTIVAVLLVVQGVARVACAQGSADLPPKELPRAIHALPVGGTSSFVARTGHHVDPQMPCDDGYWIVSSRHCPKPELDGTSSTAPDLRYFHVDACGNVRAVAAETFRESLHPAVPACIVVHGSFVSTESLLDCAPAMFRWIRSAEWDRPLQVIFFSWPSTGPITCFPQVDIALLGRRASLHGIYLARLISQLPREQPVSLFGHSHGARITASSLHLLGGGYVRGHRLRYPYPRQRRFRVVFAAAALDHHWLNPGQRYGRALEVTECVLNLRNRKDIALGAYPLRKLLSRRALGRIGLTVDDHSLLGRLMGKINEFDVTSVVSTGHLWHNYYERPEIAAAAAPYLFFVDDVRYSEFGSSSTTGAAVERRESWQALTVSGLRKITSERKNPSAVFQWSNVR